MKIKVIDLINKIANGERPKKIKWAGVVYELNPEFIVYQSKGGSCLDLVQCLNDEIEIIEEDNKIEKIEYELIAQCDNWLKDERGNFSNLKLNQYLINCIGKNTEIFGNKINEIIDRINKMEEKIKCL